MTTQGQIDAQGAADTEEVMAVVNGINDIAAEWRDFAVQELQHNADDPCYREIVLLDRRDAWAGTRGLAEGLANSAAGDLQAAISRSLARYTADDASGVWGHMSFGDWLVERGAFGLDPAALAGLFGGPLGSAIARENIRDRLPIEFTRGGPRGEPSRPWEAFKVPFTDGVWLHAPRSPKDLITQEQNGKLQGYRIRNEWWAYRKHIQQTVAGIGRPLARLELRLLVAGLDQPDQPRWVWAPGDPISPTSALGNLYELEDQLNRLLVAANIECKYFRAQQAEAARLDRAADELREERDDAARGNWQRIAALGVGALAVVAAVRK